MSEFESNKDIISCKKCNLQVKYLATKELSGINCAFPYRFVTEWYHAQSNYLINTDLTKYGDNPIYSDNISHYLQVIPYKKKIKLAKNVVLSVYYDKYTIVSNDYNLTIPFDKVTSVSVLGRNKLNIYIGSEIYQIKTKNKRFNAIKYMNIYFHSMNVAKGVNENGKLLGI